MKQGNFDSEKADKELRDRYNIHFVDLLIKKGFKTYLFGGSLRDMVLGKDWKDADIRVWIPLPPKERDEKTEEILKKANIEIISKIIFNEKFTIYRLLPAGSKSEGVIDFTVVTKQFEVIPDFTINGLYFDIGAKELIDPHGALEDIQKGIIRTVLAPEEQFKLEPHMIYRAVKCACQFGFEIEEKTLEAMKKFSNLNVGTLEVIADKKVEGMTEWFIGNVFRGIKYNPKLFVKLWNDTGLTTIFVGFVTKRLNLSTSSSSLDNSLFDEDRKYGYEEALSVFISAVAKSVDPENSENTFSKIVKLFHVDTPSIYGDFVVDISKIVYS
ncbi:MAG: hypothetical protein WAW92_03545 [Minisyncoccia bacterium]